MQTGEVPVLCSESGFTALACLLSLCTVTTETTRQKRNWVHRGLFNLTATRSSLWVLMCHSFSILRLTSRAQKWLKLMKTVGWVFDPDPPPKKKKFLTQNKELCALQLRFDIIKAHISAFHFHYFIFKMTMCNIPQAPNWELWVCVLLCNKPGRSIFFCDH